MEPSATATFAPLDEAAFSRVSAVCLGSGRFLRAVLVPALQELGCDVVLAQPRGSSFGEYVARRIQAGAGPTYEVDTVLTDGTVQTSTYPVAACGTLGTEAGREAFMSLPSVLHGRLRFVGVGVTEAGIAHNSAAMQALAEFLHAQHVARSRHGGEQPISVLNTDNVPLNGDTIRSHVLSCDFTQSLPDVDAFGAFLSRFVTFHNTMVDRITSHREGETEVPRTEPLPSKALVVEDLRSALPPTLPALPGVCARTEPGKLAIDVEMKLRIANGTHTAMVYAMALCGHTMTDACAEEGSPILPYLEQLFERDIIHVTTERPLRIPRTALTPVYTEWLARLQHRHFGISTFFVAQNASQKLSLRLLPSIRAALAESELPSVFMAFALAAMLRFLTPIGEQPRIGEQRPVFVGKLDTQSGDQNPAPAAEAGDLSASPAAAHPNASPDTESCCTPAAAGAPTAASDAEALHPAAAASPPAPALPTRFEYVPSLSVDLGSGVYEFSDGDGLVPLLLRPLGRPSGASAVAVESIVTQVLGSVCGLSPRADPLHASLCASVSSLLSRMLAGQPALSVLCSLHPDRPLFVDSTPAKLAEAVAEEVEAAEAIDVHAHCFPPEFGPGLARFGIDGLLTAAYADEDLACSADLVAQYLSVADDTAASFRALPQREQAEAVWRELFVRRSPLSDACTGVLTTLDALGLQDALANRDLPAIRHWYEGQDGAMFFDKAMRLSRLKYIITSFSPFFSPAQLAASLRPPNPLPPRHRAALELDALLEGDWGRVQSTLQAAGEPDTLRGLTRLLSRLAAALRPEYISSSTPHHFNYTAGSGSVDAGGGSPGGGGSADASPTRDSAGTRNTEGGGAAAPGSAPADGCEPWPEFDLCPEISPDAPLTDGPPSPSQLLDAVLLPLCRWLGVPLLLRMGTRRGMNAALRMAGDGSGAAHLGAIACLCSRHSTTKFLLAVLDASQQHQAAVIASRFANMHLWGSWWYAGLPSLVAQSSAARLELLGTQFTFTASSAKLHDQLIYKWRHGRALLARLLTKKYAGLVERGWRVSRGDVRRDVQRLLGGAYEEFKRKKLCSVR